MKTITFLIISLAVVISAPNKSQGQTVDELRIIGGGGEVVGLAPPPPQVPTLDLNHQRNGDTEEKIIIRWQNVSGAVGFRLYRRMHQVVTESAFSPPKLLKSTFFNPLVWHEIATRQTTGHEGNNYAYIDPLPEVNGNLPINQRRQFGMPRCYKVEAFNQYGSSESSVSCRKMRGINTPNTGSQSATQTSITVEWGDVSALEEGFKVYYRRNASETESAIIARGENNEGPVVIRGLDPDIQYSVRVVAYDYFGESKTSGSSIITTLPVPPTEPVNKTAHVMLQRQGVYEGPIPYLGSFPVLGFVPDNNVLKKIQILSQWPTLFFVKNGHSTNECNDSNAVVEIASGAETTTANLEELFGTSNPGFPINFLACKLATGGPLVNFVSIKITYGPNN